MVEETSVRSSLGVDELEAQYDPEWKNEQQERLLSSEEKRSAEDESEDNSAGDALLGTSRDASLEARHDSRRRSCRSWFSARNILIVILGILFLLMVLAQALGFKLRHGKHLPESQTIISDVQRTGFRRPPSDYVLDPNWNYGAWRTTRKYHWTITDEEVNPDGVYRQMILIDGQFPGPLVECNEGDTLSIEIENQSVNATSLHWHGIFQNGTNWMDGTVGVTSCPIPPGGKFTYEFTIKGQSGTYWYESFHSPGITADIHQVSFPSWTPSCGWTVWTSDCSLRKRERISEDRICHRSSPDDTRLLSRLEWSTDATISRQRSREF
jgi:hypothetical protein